MKIVDDKGRKWQLAPVDYGNPWTPFTPSKGTVRELGEIIDRLPVPMNVSGVAALSQHIARAVLAAIAGSKE